MKRLGLGITALVIILSFSGCSDEYKGVYKCHNSYFNSNFIIELKENGSFLLNSVPIETWVKTENNAKIGKSETLVKHGDYYSYMVTGGVHKCIKVRGN